MSYHKQFLRKLARYIVTNKLKLTCKYLFDYYKLKNEPASNKLGGHASFVKSFGEFMVYKEFVR